MMMKGGDERGFTSIHFACLQMSLTQSIYSFYQCVFDNVSSLSCVLAIPSNHALIEVRKHSQRRSSARQES